MDLLNNIKFKWKYFIYRWKFIKVLNSPFKPLKLYWYFGEIQYGNPYFYPRRIVKDKESPGMLKFKDIKYFGIDYNYLGYKTKWSATDYRFEWNPSLSIIIFGKQLYIEVKPKVDAKGGYSGSYWEYWLIYEYHTNKRLSKKDRLRECMKIDKGEFTKYTEDSTIKDNYYKYILRNKYLNYENIKITSY